MSALSKSLARAIIAHELPGHEYKWDSNDEYMILASHMAGTLDAWLNGELESQWNPGSDMGAEEFIKHMRQFSTFDMGAWLVRHSNVIDLS